MMDTGLYSISGDVGMWSVFGLRSSVFGEIEKSREIEISREIERVLARTAIDRRIWPNPMVIHIPGCICEGGASLCRPGLYLFFRSIPISPLHRAIGALAHENEVPQSRHFAQEVPQPLFARSAIVGPLKAYSRHLYTIRVELGRRG